METPCFTASIQSFAKSATLQELKSGQLTNYTDRMRSSSLKTPLKACLALKRSCTNTSSRTTSTQRSTHKADVAKAKSVQEPPKKRKYVLKKSLSKSSNIPEIIVEDHKRKVPKTSVTKEPITVQEEESVVMKVVSAQLRSLIEKDANRDNEVIQAKINEANLAKENEILRKNIEAVKQKAQMDMVKAEEELKERERVLLLKVQCEKDEEERKEKTRRDMEDALHKAKVEIQEQANKELEEFRREQVEINRKKDAEWEKMNREMKELKAKQEEDRESLRRDQVEANKQEAMQIKDQELQQNMEKKKAKKAKKKMRRLLESKKEEERDKENQEAQRLKHLKEQLQIKADYELQQVQILQMREELKEKERRRQQYEDDEHLKQRTNNEIMRRMGLVNVGKAEHDLDVQRKNLYEKN
jgi:hypothetical protein